MSKPRPRPEDVPDNALALIGERLHSYLDEGSADGAASDDLTLSGEQAEGVVGWWPSLRRQSSSLRARRS